MWRLKKKKIAYVSLALCALFLLFVFLLSRGRPQSEGSIVLPQMPADSESAGEESSQARVNVISIHPGTVQAAISTLSRPTSYRRTQTVETFWSGGSGSSVSQVAVSGDTTRVETALADGGTCHILMVGDTAAMWYDDEETWTTFSARSFSPDAAQRMLTYEAVLALSVADIQLAEYRDLDGVYCICVATHPDAEGYADTYWISVDSGLLYRAERTHGEDLIYRFSASEPEAEPPEADRFLLPDGSSLQP